MSTLHQLTGELLALYQQLESDGMDDETIRDTLEGMSWEFDAKVLNIAAIILELEAQAAAIKAEEERLAERRKAKESKAENMAEWLLKSLEAAHVGHKIENALYSVSARQNPVRVLVLDADAIPAQYMVQNPPPPPSLNKKAVQDAIKSGEAVPGCELIRTSRLVIK